MVAEMYEHNDKSGLAPEEAAKMEIAMSLAMLSSGSNTTFWLLHQIFSELQTLQQIRTELNKMSMADVDTGIPKRKIVELDRVRAHCPTLMATLNETLRFHAP